MNQWTPVQWPETKTLNNACSHTENLKQSTAMLLYENHAVVHQKLSTTVQNGDENDIS